MEWTFLLNKRNIYTLLIVRSWLSKYCLIIAMSLSAICFTSDQNAPLQIITVSSACNYTVSAVGSLYILFMNTVNSITLYLEAYLTLHLYLSKRFCPVPLAPIFCIFFFNFPWLTVSKAFGSSKTIHKDVLVIA